MRRNPFYEGNPSPVTMDTISIQEFLAAEGTMSEPLELKEAEKIHDLLKQLIMWGIRNNFNQTRDFTEDEIIMMNHHLPKKIHTLTSGYIRIENTLINESTQEFDTPTALSLENGKKFAMKSTNGEIQLCSISGNTKWQFSMTDNEIHIK
jgi:hypothetical protein